MHWPSVTALAGELRRRNANTEGPVTVVLHVWHDGEWRVDRDVPYGSPGSFTGDFQARAEIPGVQRGVVKRFNARDLARQLIDDAKENRVNEEFIQAGERERAHGPFFMQRGTDDYGNYNAFPQPGSRYLHGLGAVQSMTYGTMPTLQEFVSLLEWHPYDFELRGSDAETASRYAVQLRGPLGPRELYRALTRLTNAWRDGDDEAGDLASAVLQSIGVEWI